MEMLVIDVKLNNRKTKKIGEHKKKVRINFLARRVFLKPLIITF